MYVFDDIHDDPEAAQVKGGSALSSIPQRELRDSLGSKIDVDDPVL